MDITKRKLLAAGGLGVLVGGGTGAKGAEVDPSFPGFTVRIRKNFADGWCICVPDLDSSTMMGNHPETFISPIKWMPLKEWLAIMDGNVQP